MVIFLEGRIRNSAKVESYARKILGHYDLLNKKGYVVIQFKTQLENGYVGLSHGCKDNVVIEISKTENGEKLEMTQMMQILAHELVHAKQYLKGELASPNGKLRWKRKTYDHVDYYEQPWEVEAYSSEEDLFTKYWYKI